MARTRGYRVDRYVALAAALTLVACTQGTRLEPTATGEEGSGVERSFSLLTDIPVPPNSTLDVEKSLILGDLDRWTGRIILNVGHSAPQVFQLYQSQMPGFGWEPVMSVQADTSVLSFTRGERAATVQISSRSLGGSSVAVTVAPRHSGATGSAGGAPGAVRVMPMDR